MEFSKYCPDRHSLPVSWTQQYWPLIPQELGGSSHSREAIKSAEEHVKEGQT